MKKTVLTLLLLVPLCVTGVTANEYEIKVPEWKDFVPPAFANVKEPKGIGKLNMVASYWYQRRMSFEDGLNRCQEETDIIKLQACYENLKTQQYKENSDYNARMEANERSTSGIPEMNSMTDTMVPLSNCINTFTNYMPNEFR